MWLNINCTRLFSPNSVTYSSSYLPPANEVSEGYVFTGVCLSMGGCLPLARRGVRHPLGRTPLGRHPWDDTPWVNNPLGRHPPPVLPSACWDTHTPVQCMLGYIHPPTQCMLGYRHLQPSACWDTVNKRAVRIPLECILVVNEQAWQWKQNNNMMTKCN